MPIEINKDEVDRRLARLQDEYGDLEVERRDEVWEPPEFEGSLARADSGYLGGAYVFAVREPEQDPSLTESMPESGRATRRRVLLAMGRDDEDWGPPGGGREEGETFEEAAVREVREETGVDVEVADLVHALRWTTRSSGDRDERVHTLFVTFEGRYVDGQIAIQPGELYGAGWFAELPAARHRRTEIFAERWDPSPGAGRESNG